MKIQTIDTLAIGRYWGGVAPHKSASVQGTMDGACGPYALFNMLVLGGYIGIDKLESLWNARPDGRSLLGKWQKTCGPLLLHGTTIDDISELLQALQPSIPSASSLSFRQILAPKDHDAQQSEKANRDVLEEIGRFLVAKDKPLLIGISGPYINHWTVAVGCSFRRRKSEDVLSEVLLIDPSETVPQLHAWNAIVSQGFQGERRLRFSSMANPEGTICSVDGAWAID